MHLHEEAVAPRGNRSPDKRTDVFRRAPGRPVLPAPGLLHRMGSVEDHRSAGRLPDSREVAHVHNEVAVPERRSPFGHEHLPRSSGTHLLDRAGHRAGRHPLTLLHIHGPAGRSRREQQCRLPAKEGRDLEHVRHLGGGPGLVRLMNVGQDGQTRLPAHGGEAVEAAGKTGTAV